ncbi:RDD family protein [Haloplasma contractile]|uniref:RDD domain containing protein n=1 Tax=Haloplasma contractile SSD-17B TaxID=1033810 RepID=F7PRP2_9MOLU|nr:RDD family protein [Haloplasma contractile]ERJ11878.1 RDD domain containing protein [Haloplasma contractile SSD-17B]
MLKKSIGMRFIAYIIDFIMIYIVAFIFHLMFGFFTLTRSATSVYFSMNFIELTIMSILYFVFFALVTQGKTIGKLITRVQVRKSNLEEVTRKQIVIRELLKSALMIINLISFIVLLIRKDKKSIHDLIVDTIVVRPIKKGELIQDNQDHTEITETEE